MVGQIVAETRPAAMLDTIYAALDEATGFATASDAWVILRIERLPGPHCHAWSVLAPLLNLTRHSPPTKRLKAAIGSMTSTGGGS